MNENNEILNRLKALEDENLRLKQQVEQKSQAKMETTTRISDYKGNPVINFEGDFKPFSFGFKKAVIILEKIDDIREFVKSQETKDRS